MISNNVKAEKEAIKIIDTFNQIVPIDVNYIAKKLEINVILETLEETVSGMLVIKDKNATIAINKIHHENRQRFTLAHEIGHFILHGKKQNIFIDNHLVFHRGKEASEGVYTKEIEANIFAAELLMPKTEVFKKVIEINILNENNITELSQYFKVSKQAFTHRLRNLGLINIFE